MTVDDRLQNLTNSERTIAVLLVEAGSPLSPLMVAGVVDIKHKLQSNKGFRVKALDRCLKLMPGRLDSARSLEWVIHMRAERQTRHDEYLEFADQMRRSLLKVARADAVEACSSKRSEHHVVGVWFPALVKQARLEDFRVMCISVRD